MSNYLKFTEAVQFSFTDQALIKVKDDYTNVSNPQVGANTQQSNGLHVSIAATHSGIITRNNGFYLPDRMQRGASSFTDNYQKPILLHHEEAQDPVGRVIESAYIDTSESIQDSLAEGLIVKDRVGKEKGVITEALMKDFVSGVMPFSMQVDTIISLFKDSLLKEDGYGGLGYINIIALIQDRQAVEKLIDGRYLTGSVGATTDKAVCSICRQDWTEAGRCEHKPGAIYDEAQCFIIAGNLAYDEYSFVNVPADRHSKVLELHYNGIQDSVEIAEEYSGRIHEVRLGFPQYDSVAKENKGMANEEKDPKVDQEATEEEEVVVTDSQTSESAEQPTESQDENVEVEDATEENTEETIEDFVARVTDADELSEEDEVKLYDAMWEEAEAGFKDKEFTLEELDVEKLEDAKLTTEKRNKLAKSTFCGPNRSFPVPDCAHVVAARRLIDRTKISDATKEKILACVSRKAKAMGCDGSKKTDSVETPNVEDALMHGRIMHMVVAALEEAQHYSSDPVLEDAEVKTLQSILKRLSTLVGKDAFVSAAITEGLAANPECEQALTDEVVKLEDTVGGLRDQLDALRKEYSSLFKDMETQQDVLVEVKTTSRKAIEDRLSILKTLQDGKIDEEANFSTLSDSDLHAEIDRVLKEVDMAKIVDKLGDGMARTPEGTVEDPSAIQDENVTQKSSVNKLATPEQLKQIQEQHMKLMFSPGGRTVADAYIRRLQVEGILPLDSQNK